MQESNIINNKTMLKKVKDRKTSNNGILIIFEDGSTTLITHGKIKKNKEAEHELPNIGDEINFWDLVLENSDIYNSVNFSYSELLESDEWKNRREEIIVRDKYLCQNCYNMNIIRNCLEGEANKIHNHLYGFHIEINNNGFILGNTFLSEGCKSILPEKSKIYFYMNEERHFKILAFKNIIDDKYIFVPGLHVHHKYYQDRLKPWEYPDYALTTLCWVCHEQLHAKINVPKLDMNGNNIGQMTPCSRCCGAGIFPEFRHVNAGICFKCNGARYKELI